jgi:para-nitrobenzyl esterase
MLRGIPKEDATETALRLLAGLGIKEREAHKLANVPAAKLLEIQLAGSKSGGALGVPTANYLARHSQPPPEPAALRPSGPGGWGAVLDGHYLPQNPFDPTAPSASSTIPLLIGNMRDEAVFFERENPQFFHLDENAVTALAHNLFGDAADHILDVYRRAMPGSTPVERAIAVETALAIGNHTVALADRKSLQPAPVYRYRNDYSSNVPVVGTDWTLRAAHATDLAVVFDNAEIPDLQGDGPGLAEAARAMSGYFASFARSGVPSASGQPAWPRYDTERRAVMLLNSECTVVYDPDSEQRQLWHSLGLV